MQIFMEGEAVIQKPGNVSETRGLSYYLKENHLKMQEIFCPIHVCVLCLMSLVLTCWSLQVAAGGKFCT